MTSFIHMSVYDIINVLKCNTGDNIILEHLVKDGDVGHGNKPGSRKAFGPEARPNFIITGSTSCYDEHVSLPSDISGPNLFQTIWNYNSARGTCAGIGLVRQCSL